MVRITLKTTLAGEGAVGKASLVMSFMYQKFMSNYKIIVGMDVVSKTIIEDGHEITSSVHDIASYQLS